MSNNETSKKMAKERVKLKRKLRSLGLTCIDPEASTQSLKESVERMESKDRIYKPLNELYLKVTQEIEDIQLNLRLTYEQDQRSELISDINTMERVRSWIMESMKEVVKQ